MKKVVIIIILMLIIAIPISILVVKNINKDSRISNDKAEQDEDGRYITIINNTEQIINEVYVTVGNGTEIDNMKQTNPDEKSFSIKIPKQYEEYEEFSIYFIDRYNMQYKKDITITEKKGRTEVVINKEDYIEKKGDFWNKMDKFFNGD